MPRYATKGGTDSDLVTDDDHGFVGVDMSLQASQLETGAVNADVNRSALWPGVAAFATNYRFRGGLAEPRLGMVEPKWANAETYGTILGACVFSDPNRVEHILLATAAGVWVLRDGLAPRLSLYEAGESVTSAWMVQAFDRVLLFRGATLPPLEWDGDMRSVWRRVEQSDLSGSAGTEQIPNGEWATLHANRLWVAHGRDSLAASDLLDYTRYDPALSDFRVNAGEDDSLVAAVPYGAGSLVLFKSGSVYLLESATGDLSELSMATVNPTIGCAARDSVAQAGDDLVFLSHDGVYTLGQILDTKVASRTSALSWPVAPLVDRINWAAASGACAAMHDGLYHLAVPLDGESANSAVLVYDAAARQWQGYDSCAAAAWRVDRWLISEFRSRKRLFAVDYAAGKVRLCDEGYSDLISGSEHGIRTELLTRGYLCGTPDRKRFRRVSIDVSTWAPTYSVSLEVDGQAETQALATAQTKSRTRYFAPWGRADWSVANASDDHATRGREDYSVLSNQGTNPKTGVNPHLHQEHCERHELREAGRTAAVRVSATGGRVRVRGVHVEALVAGRQQRAQA